MKQLIENYETVESYCKRKQNELSSVPDIYDEANLDHKQDQEYQNYIINIYQEYQQYHPLIIKEKLRLLFIKYCQIKEENLPSFQLQQYQLTCQQTIQYLLSILNYILQKDENQKIEFYANPQIKIKCYEQKHNLFQTDKHKIYLGQFQSIISKFIHYLTNQMTFDSKGIKIILSLIDYKQPALELFKKSTRNLYNKLIQYLDLEQYLKEELLYELKDESSPFFYKLNKCNYNICFNDYRIKDANGPGFLPVIQRIKGYKGYGNLLMINAKQDEWQNVKIYNCKYEMMLIYKKLSNASFNLFKKGAQFRYISNHQIIKYYQSYRVLFHNIEKSTYNNYFDHYRNFIFLYEQFLQDNQLDITISKQFKQLINEENIKINIFLEGLKQTVDTNYNKQQLIFKIQQNTVESINQYIDESVIKLQENLLKIVQNISDLIQEWINNIYKQSLKKKNNISQNHLDQLKIYLLRQLETEKYDELIKKLDYFKEQNFNKQKLSQGSQSLIYYCENQITKRHFALGQPFKNYGYTELQANVQKVQNSILRQQRKGICKIFKIDSNYMWMEFAKIGNLSDYLINSRNLHYLEYLQICYQISQIVQQLHNSNIYHLDLKLENFIVAKKYGLYRIKICDFGSMTDQKDLKVNIDKQRMLYAPPEAKKNEKIQSDKYDIWQLGNIYKSIQGYFSKTIIIPEIFQKLLLNNPKDRPEIKQVVQQIEKYIINNLDQSMYRKLFKGKLMHYFISYLEVSKSQQFAQQQKDFQYQGTYHKFNQIRKDDKQYFNLQFSTQKCDGGVLSRKNFIIYDILSSVNNWIQIYLFRQKRQIQKYINKQYWSLYQKILFFQKIFKKFKLINYFESQSYQQTEFVIQFKYYADELRSLLANDNYDYDEEKDFNIKIVIFQSLIIDVFSYNFNQCQTLLELKEIAKKICLKKSKILNKNSFVNHIESVLYKTLDLNQLLKNQLEFSNITRIFGYIYLVSKSNQKFYLKILKGQPNLEIQDKIHFDLIKPRFIRFAKLQFKDYQLYQMDINNNFQLYIKFVVQQTILNYQGNNFLDSPFNLIESVFIDKRNQKFIKNVLYVPDKDLNQYIDFPKYLAQILSYQLVIIGSRTFDQKIQDRYQQLNNDSLILKDQKKQQTEQIFIQLILSMFQLRKKLRIQKQIDFLYFIQDHWNLDLVNLIFLCKKLKDNPNYIIENNMNQTQQNIDLNKYSTFKYYCSIENLQNASQLYRAYIQSQLIEVIIFQQKQNNGISESNQKRILIDSFESEWLSGQYQKEKEYSQNKKVLKYNVYLEIKSKELNQICQQLQLYSIFDWISLIKCLLSNFDVYHYYQYLKIQYDKDIIIKLLIVMKYYKIFKEQQLEQLDNLILLFKQQSEFVYLNKLLDLMKQKLNDKIFIISQNILQFKMQILNIKQSDFSFINCQMNQNQLNNKQQNLVSYLAYFLLINSEYQENIYYDLNEEQIYLDYKINRFHIQYKLLFQEQKLNKMLQYEFIVSLLRNFKFRVDNETQEQINYIVDQYNFQIGLEQQGYHIVSKLNYVIPQRICILRYQQIQQKYLCSYNFGTEYLDYNNFKVIQNKNSFNYRCYSIVKLEGQIINLTQLQKNNIQIVDKITYQMKNIAKILFNQGYEYQALESNLVIIINQLNIFVYPVTIKKVQDSLDNVYKRINQFQQKIEEKIISDDKESEEEINGVQKIQVSTGFDGSYGGTGDSSSG